MGAENVFNPVKLVESLRLRTSEQQDAQEYVNEHGVSTSYFNLTHHRFSKLFMSHLDDEFKKQTNPDLKSLLPNQVRACQYFSE